MAETEKHENDHHIPDEARQHFHAAKEEMKKGLEQLFPPEFMDHRRKAQQEMLLAWRSMIDHALERMEERGKKTS